ncbi:MAG TPA: MFS transporter [candidate division Zixibacteria bacterium]|nr:MFS transporter [candidate division Zixibacteria bacterium]
MTDASPRGAWSPGRRLLTAGLVFFTTASAFEGLAVPTVLPETLDELGNLALYGWAFSGFWLASLVGATLGGREADRRGPMPPFAVGVGCFALGLLVAGLAPSMEWVVAGRVVQGLGSGATAAMAYVAIALGYDAVARPRMIAVISSAWVLPGLVGPALAGFITQELSWRWIFLGLVPMLPLAAVTTLGPLQQLRADPADRTGDGGVARVSDALLLVAGAGLVLGGLSMRNLLALVAVPAGLLLAARPLRRLLPPGTLNARPGRPAAIVVLLLLNVGFFGVEAFVPLTVSSIRGAGPLIGGLALTTASVTWAAGSWVQARLANGGSRRPLMVAGLSLVVAGIGLTTSVLITGVPVWVAALAWAVAGFGMGLCFSAVTLAAIEGAPAGAEGSTSGAVQLANTLGTAVGTGAAGAIVALGGASAMGLAPGIAISNLVMLVVCAVAIAAAGRVGERGPTTEARRTAIPVEHGPAL